jgi:hypothetical protein
MASGAEQNILERDCSPALSRAATSVVTKHMARVYPQFGRSKSEQSGSNRIEEHDDA